MDRISRIAARRLAAAVTVVLVVVSLTACDWTQFRYGPEHTGSSSDTSISPGAVKSGSLVRSWTGMTGDVVQSSPAVSNGVVYVGSNDNMLYAFDAKGSTGCSGNPKACTPLWKSILLGGDVVSSPAVANGLVYIASLGKQLFAFDAAGINGCSGTPKVCTPVWRAVLAGDVISSPTVADGRVFVVSAHGFADTLYAFDATTGAPLWSTTVPQDEGESDATHSSPAVANGIVYVGFTGDQFVAPPELNETRVAAFDATGTTGCSGSPKTCQPLWTAIINTSSFQMGSPTISGGLLYVRSDESPAMLYAFDATGVNGCSGTPKSCQPLWSAPTSDGIDSSPAVANGIIYDGPYAFDAAGVTGCSGSPKVCQPLWTATASVQNSSPSVANGVLYDGPYAYDAAGVTGCSGRPKTCLPLWTAPTGGGSSSPAISNGKVYVGSNDHKLYAFALETVPPSTSIAIPADGATASGGAVLIDATATDNVGVAKVEYHLTGGTFNDALIGAATSTQFGWLLSWNSTSVPNGSYTLNSVATDFAGNVGRSPARSLTVQN